LILWTLREVQAGLVDHKARIEMILHQLRQAADGLVAETCSLESLLRRVECGPYEQSDSRCCRRGRARLPMERLDLVDEACSRTARVRLHISKLRGKLR
jgi:hypothetical protein